MLSILESKERLEALRAEMARQHVDGYVLPIGDEFLSEYPPEAAQRVAWLTGFNGSAGTVVVTAQQAALVTDGRYTLQASQQLPPELYEVHNSADLTPVNWLKQQMKKDMRLGYDASLFSMSQLTRMEDALAQAGILMSPMSQCPVDLLWKDRPAMPSSVVEVHGLEYSGKSSADKRRDICRMMKERHVDALFIASSDSIAWLFNIRAHDLPHTPVALCFALLCVNEHEPEGQATIFIDALRVDKPVREHLGSNTTILPMNLLETTVTQLGEARRCRVWVDLTLTPANIGQILAQAEGVNLVMAEDPCQLPKACKNAVEVEGMRKAHIMDGAAMCRFFSWFYREGLRQGLTEVVLGDRLEGFRTSNPACTGLSFSTIAGYGPNGAIVHYRAEAASAATIEEGSILLIDSGGQYREGTTDITRTIAIGDVTPAMREHFTLVLKGHIALASAVFPKGTTGSQLDAMARSPLWHKGLDYDHGTGHGVGSFLNVHEGPQRISKSPSTQALLPGMILSNEPGYYRQDYYGIRIENLVVVEERPELSSQRPFYGFETLTMVPIDRQLVIKDMLSEAELSWLNGYHKRVFATIAPMLDETERDWLALACSEI
ncbi:M24 family metallopeptidase [bacterium]|nr:M24 family metallopeptidase [bacterium]